MTTTSIHRIQLAEAHCFSLWGLLTGALQQIPEPCRHWISTERMDTAVLALHRNVEMFTSGVITRRRVLKKVGRWLVMKTVIVVLFWV